MALGLQEIVDVSSSLLGTPTILEDRDFNLVAFHGQASQIDPVRQRSILERGSTEAVRAWFEQFGIATASGPLATPADPEQGTIGRLCIPARWNGVNHGYLWALDPHAELLDAAVLPEAVRLAEHAGALLAQRDSGRRDSAILLEALVSPDADVSRGAADELVDRHLVDSGTAVALLEVTLVVDPSGGVAGAVPLNVWTLPRGVLATVRPGHATLLVPVPGVGDAGRVAARRTADEIRRQHDARSVGRSALRLVIGIGDPRPTLGEARASHRQAALAGRVAGSEASLGDTLAWSELGVYRVLTGRAEPDLAAALIDERVSRLLDPAHADLLRTARVFLDEAGSVARTSAALAVHRQTTYHRLGRIETLTGLDLANGRDRLLLHLALTLEPLLGPRAVEV